MRGESDIPRWAKELEAGQWVRLNELIDAGHKTSDIVRELSIPDRKVRSLQEYVRKCGPKRRLAQFARFKDALLAQIEKFGADMVKALSVTAALAVSNETPPAAQVRAIEAMNNFITTLSRMVGDDAKEVRDADVPVENSDKRKKLSKEAIRTVRSLYGLAPAAGDEEHDES